MKTTAILDIDGTLIDSNYDHVRAWHHLFRRQGLFVPQVAIHRGVGMGGDQLLPHLLGWEEGDPRIKQLSDIRGELYRSEYIEQIRPLPGVEAFIARLEASGYRIALASSSDASELEHYVQLLNLAGRLDACVSKGDVEESKPEPDVFATALRKVDAGVGEALVLGDSVWDGAAARRLGLDFVGVLTGGFGEDELRRAGAVEVYRDLPHLLEEWDESPFGRDRAGG